MTTKSNILGMFREGKTVQEVSKYFSTKTVYKYYRLHLLIEIKNNLQHLCDSEAYENLEVPRLKVLLREVLSW